MKLICRGIYVGILDGLIEDLEFVHRRNTTANELKHLQGIDPHLTFSRSVGFNTRPRLHFYPC